MSVTTADHACSTHAAYKLTCESYEALVKASDGACWRCGTKGVQLEVDHDHEVGVNAVRGLLCRPCNAHMVNVDANLVLNPADHVYLASAWHASRVIEYMKDLRTPRRSVRVDDELWVRAQAKAKDRRESVADVIRRALLAYVEETA